MQNIKIYILTLVVFFLVDIVWLTVISRKLYAKYLGYIMTENVNWLAALLFYILFIAGLVFFVINPALVKESLRYAILAGGFFGLVTYATYDLTNLATLKDWPILITVIDLVWGTFVTATTSGITYYLATRFK
ncbi:MAG: DUF2177 family protein [Clostridiaceae bacterium]